MTMDYKKKIEIPFGAFDSELIRQEISIPNGFKAVIDGNKIILTRAESANEKIRKEIVDFIDINTIGSDERRNRWFSYLEKQGESYTKRDVDDAWLKGMCDAKRELEKQGEEQPIIRWHSINEEPEEMKELFCEWESDDATWHDVAFYDKESHTFRHAKMPINVTKWVYVDELLEEQAEVVSDKDDIEAEEEGIREAFNKIEDEKQCKQKPTQEIEPFEAEHGKYYYCIKDYFCGGRKQASKGDVVQALRGLPIMGLKDAGEYFLPVNSIKCNSAWSEDDEKMLVDAYVMLDWYKGNNWWTARRIKDWLNSLKERIGG